MTEEKKRPAALGILIGPARGAKGESEGDDDEEDTPDPMAVKLTKRAAEAEKAGDFEAAAKFRKRCFELWESKPHDEYEEDD